MAQRHGWTERGRGRALALAAVVGAVLGLGLYTFDSAEGLSYFSSDPKACANCHIMLPQYDGWTKASHHAAATCNDCHLPTDFAGKWLAKASNGWHHSKGFTLQNFQEPIRIKPMNSRILQDNCLRCHGDLVHDLVAGASTDDDAQLCVHCHFTVGHGPVGGLGGPLTDAERRVPR